MTPTAPILVVEDDRDIRESIEDALTSEGYTVVTAVDGLDALERLRADPDLPKLIVLDLMMPRMNGHELRVELAKVPAWSTLPVIVMTADANARRLDSLPSTAFFTKPLKLNELFDAVAAVMRS